MTLTLEVTGPEAGALGGAYRKVFGPEGGTIGRHANNAWVLPHPHVSSHHAVIRYQDGIFTIEDTSRNGIGINDPDSRLPQGVPQPLAHGDCLYIHPYTVMVSVASDRVARPADRYDHAVTVDDPFAPATPRRSPPRAFDTPASPLVPEPDSEPGGNVDPINVLGFDSAPRGNKAAPKAADLQHGSVLADHYHPPAPVPARQKPASGAAELIPENYDPLASSEYDLAGSVEISPRSQAPSPAHVDLDIEPPPPAPAPAPVRPPDPRSLPVRAAPPPNDAGFSALLEGAGLQNVPVTPQLANDFGRIFRAVVSGVMDALRTRQAVKDEFRVRATRFMPAENNPLKFSADVDDALHNLLVKHNAAYLGPVEAFEDAFEDIRNHQIAMLEGLRVAFAAMITEFDPDTLEQQLGASAKKSGLLGTGRPRYWDLYRERMKDVLKDPDASFRKLFGDRFAEAYEEQLNRLKSQKPKRRER